MEFEGWEAIRALLKGKKKWQQFVGWLLTCLIIIITLVSILKSSDLLSRFREHGITFKGTVYEKDGKYAVGVLVFLEKLPNMKYSTDSQGQYAIPISNTNELGCEYVTIVFERPNSNRVTRSVCWKNRNYIYNEVVLNY